LCATDEPYYNPGLALALEESRNDLRATPHIGIAWSMGETGNYVDLSEDDIGSGGEGAGTNTVPSGVKDGEEEKFDYNLLPSPQWRALV
jgi:hypothetical protein